MNKKILIAILASISFIMFFACKQEYQGTLIPMQDENTSKWGYSDTLGKSVIAYKWDTASVFSENLAVVGMNGRYGYIDRKGTEVIPLKYDVAKDFSDNLALVKVDGKCGFINNTGEELIPLKYDNDITFVNGLALVTVDGKYGFINKSGEEIIPLKYDNATTFTDGLAEVEIDGKIGVIDTADNIVVAFQYKELKYLIGEWALTKVNMNTDENKVFSINGSFEITKIGKIDLLTFEKDDNFKSDIDFSDDDIFLNVKSLSFTKNDKWQFDNFVLGQSSGSKNTFIFSCNLKLLPQAEKFNYELCLQEKDILNIKVSETVNRPGKSTKYGVTKGGLVRYKFELKFIRLESLKK